MPGQRLEMVWNGIRTEKNIGGEIPLAHSFDADQWLSLWIWLDLGTTIYGWEVPRHRERGVISFHFLSRYHRRGLGLVLDLFMNWDISELGNVRGDINPILGWSNHIRLIQPQVSIVTPVTPAKLIIFDGWIFHVLRGWDTSLPPNIFQYVWTSFPYHIPWYAMTSHQIPSVGSIQSQDSIGLWVYPLV